ncbi:glycoside hydrolase family 16 protein [Antarcticibacterium sp. 1MA-6-2]|uniref:glycoside hydrolase family 16 protein n=1 Tax=Antarcticibacterium sp. 1MA-6-2 TaxID=2908210 RepID=UPI001F338E8D|nr:glycoside hydrolase family 16 protein [Antarcticibacterium sp. 1MA-6-2]UJH91736.1 glycoside hydrolase family 16 protein [Antarcticibacterium sp. 1MA-6-2]
MKKGKFYFRAIVVVILNTVLLGCSSSDDSEEPEPLQERIRVKMPIPDEGDIDWSNVELVWNEEFDGSTKLEDIWFFESNDPNNPNTADELQTYQKENVVMNGGTLKILAKEKTGDYTSARLTSKYAFQYGRIEINAKLPRQQTKGLWTKMALIGDNIDVAGWPLAGEIDVVEHFTNDPNKIYNYIHSGTNNGANGTLISSEYSLESPGADFHVYGILWTNKYIKFYIDNSENITYTFLRPSTPTDQNWPFDKPFYLLTKYSYRRTVWRRWS